MHQKQEPDKVSTAQKKEFIVKIQSQYQQHVTTQSYTKQPQIAGVEVLPLTFHQDDGGNFAELFRLDAGEVTGLQAPFTAQQISMSVLVPGTIKAYHLHYKQDDLWFVPPAHRLLVNLHDLREESPTVDLHQRLVLGAGSAKLLRIPAGVAHGAANLYTTDMFLFYATSEKFSTTEPDEHRLPWDHFGAEVWELTRG
jgi:dTDP-4-dehydrorhamnose 3,5-epimerase-like enzyme